MHYLVRIIGEAQTPEAAGQNARATAEEMIEEGGFFDYYDDTPRRYEESGTTVQLSSEAGKLAVQQALGQNRAAFMAAIAPVRKMLEEYTDEQMYQNDYGLGQTTMANKGYLPSRYHFAVIGSQALGCYLYVDGTVWGEGVTNDSDYASLIEDRNQDELWVTSLDFHA